MKIVFMGTPQFAVPTLLKLIDSKHEIIAVYTKPLKPYGRGQKTVLSPVNVVALNHDLPTYTPKNFKNKDDLKQLQNLSADIIIVIAYGLILPLSIIQAFKYDAINVHPSLLPRWRGAAPIQRTIMSGDEQTAICIMKMDEGLDTGEVILSKNFGIQNDMTASELADMLSHESGNLILDTLDLFESSKVVYHKQNGEATYAAKITQDEEAIDWNMNAYLVNCLIRGLSPKPGAHFKYKGEIIKIITADYDMTVHNQQYGKVLNDKLHIACKEGILKPTLLQRQGKKMIYTDAFLRGFKINAGEVLT